MEYAQILRGGEVNIIKVSGPAVVDQLTAQGMDIRDISAEDPKPSTGWKLHSDDNYYKPIRWVKVENDVVVATDVMLIQPLAQSDVDSGVLHQADQLDAGVAVGWTYNDGDGTFSAPA